MTEPDFDQIAARLADASGALTEHGRFVLMRDELRQVWNARGAADLAAMETAHENYDWTELEDAIRSLDR